MELVLDSRVALGVICDGDEIVLFTLEFFVDNLEYTDLFLVGVAFPLEGVFLQTLAKTLGVFALTFRLITMVSGDFA